MKFEENRGFEREDAVKKAKKRKRKRRNRQAAVILLVVMMLSLITLTVLSLTVFFKISDIKVSGSGIYNAQEIISCAEIKIGDNLFLVSENKVSQLLQKRLPFIAEVQITRNLPSTLSISIKETKEEICFSDSKDIYSANFDGKILKKYSEIPTDFIMVTVSDKTVISEGDKVQFSTERELELFTLFMQKIEEYGYDVDFINITDPYAAYMKLEGRIIVKLGSSAYFENKIAYLDASLSSVSKSASGVFDLSAWTPKNNKSVLTYCDISKYEK